jgi:hypothetical protein
MSAEILCGELIRSDLKVLVRSMAISSITTGAETLLKHCPVLRGISAVRATFSLAVD